jgi:hypothetical protein
VTADAVRDATQDGKSTISGGVYVDAWVGAAQPGDEATVGGAQATLRVRVQAASWVDVDTIEVVVDGQTAATVAVPASTDVVRWDGEIPIDVAEAGSYVIVAAWGDEPLEPVHPGRYPFGATNPIFLLR